MRSVAITQGKARLDSARAALERAREARSYPAFAQAWSEFLTACGGIYTKLQQGAKGCGKSEGWFGRKKHDRGADPLLAYLHQARNADEHGIDPVSWGAVQHAVEFPTDVPMVSDRTYREGDKTVREVKFVEPVHPNRLKIHRRLAFALVKVRNSKYGDEFAPPTSHLGEPIAVNAPFVVADLGVAYFERLLVEAAELPQRP